MTPPVHPLHELEVPMFRSRRRCVRIGLLAALMLAGCAGTSHQAPEPADVHHDTTAPTAGSPFSDTGGHSPYSVPLFVDRSDLRLGTTVQFHGHIPNASELHDLTNLPGF